VLSATPARAHGVGGRTDLPLPLWLFTYGAAAAVIASFVALRFLWPRPRLNDAAAGRVSVSVPAWLRAATLIVGRALGLASFVLVFIAAWWGSDDPSENLAPVALYVIFWVGFQLAAALFGDLWVLVNPFDTVVAAAQSIRRWVGGGGGESTGQTERRNPAQWSAALLLLSFIWLELAYHDSASPRAVAVWLAAYFAAVLAGAAWWGREWLRYGEGFGALFDALGHLSPLSVADGRMRVRAPFSGLAAYRARMGSGALIVIVLGSTGFDGLARTEFWATVVRARTGWNLTLVSTVGLLFVILLMGVVYLGAMRVMAATVDGDLDDLAATFLASLIPIVLAYSLAHYFSLLIFEGQSAYALISDPLGLGWNVFGSVGHQIKFTVVSVNAIAYVQVGAIVVGHIVGVTAAHDRSVELFPRSLAEASQYPLLAVMVLYTVGGLAVLLGG